MADIRLLERTLAGNVAWNRARTNFVARFVIARIQLLRSGSYTVASKKRAQSRLLKIKSPIWNSLQFALARFY
jgi:hypothetical protein